MHSDSHTSRITFLAFVGASGSGKTTLIDALMKERPEFERGISCTTRPKRDSDPRGEYAYFSREEFEDHVRKDAFQWWGEFAGHRYGTLKRTLNDALSAKYARVLTLTPEKNLLLNALHPSRVLSFLIVVSDKDVLRGRMLARGDSPADVSKRVELNREWERQEAESVVPYLVIDNSGSVASGVRAILTELEARGIA